MCRYEETVMTDEQVLEWAVEEERIIVTCDKDFERCGKVTNTTSCKASGCTYRTKKDIAYTDTTTIPGGIYANTIITVSGNNWIRKQAKRRN